jgi:YegS/Rv2252/BmrU family lipid kinase
VYLTQSAGDAARIVREEGENYDVIVCAGGDGTLGNTVSGFMESGLKRPLGYIPCGSTNDYARSLDIPKQAIDAAERIVQSSTFAVDIGNLNNNYFVYVAAFGIFSDTSYATPQNMKNILGHAAYVLQGIKSIVNIPTYNLKVEFDGQVYTGEFIYGMVSNSVSIGGYKSLTSRGVEFDDGLFEGVLIRRFKNPADLQRIINALLMGNTNDRNMVAFRTSRVVIESEEPIAWTIDGEYGGTYTTSEITVHNKAVELLVSPPGVDDDIEAGNVEAAETDIETVNTEAAETDVEAVNTEVTETDVEAVEPELAETDVEKIM